MFSPRRVATLLLLLVAPPLAILLALSIEALSARLALSETELARRSARLLEQTAQAAAGRIALRLDRLAASPPGDGSFFRIGPDGRTIEAPRSGYWAEPAGAPLSEVFGRQLEWALRLASPAEQLQAWEEMLQDWPTPREEAILRFRRAVSLLQGGKPAEARAALEELVESAGPARDGAGIPVGLLAGLYLGRVHREAGEPFRAAGALLKLQEHLVARAWEMPEIERTLFGERAAEQLRASEQLLRNPDERAYLARRQAEARALGRSVAWIRRRVAAGLAAGPRWDALQDPEDKQRLVYHRRTAGGATLLLRLPRATVQGWLGPLLEQQGARRQARFVFGGKASYLQRPFGPLLPGSRLGVDPWGLAAARQDARRRVWLHAGSIALALVMIGVCLATGYRFLCREVEAARSKEAFLAGISHELKTPLTSIRLFAESMADGGVPEPKVRQYARRIDREARRLGRLIEGVLDLAALERGQVRLACEPLPAEQAAAEALALFEHRAGSDRCVLELSPPDGEPVLLADPDALVQVLLVLLDNAAKYSPEGGRVRLSAGAEEQRVWLAVADEGPGIPAPERARVTERFYRGSAAGSTPGLGLGLAIAATLVRAMQGELVFADAPGGGTLARVLLPAARLEAVRDPT